MHNFFTIPAWSGEESGRLLHNISLKTNQNSEVSKQSTTNYTFITTPPS